MKLAIIVAQSNNRVIGLGNDLPWKLPKDLQYFKQATMGKPIIMGRKTYDSIGRALPGRRNIVITRNASFSAPGVDVVPSLEAAIELAEQVATVDGVDQAMIIGGAQIYSQALALADLLFVTQVHADVEGDAFFPAFDLADYRELAREDNAADEANPYDYSFICYEKCTA